MSTQEKPQVEPGAMKALAGVWVAALFSASPLIGIFPLILGSVAQQLHIGRGEVSMLITLFIVSNAFATPVLGRIADRRGARIVALGSVAALGVVALVLGLVPVSLTRVFLLVTVLGLFSPLVVLNSKVVAGWFGKRRGLALSTVAIATAVLSSLFVQLNRRLLDHFGWQAIYLSLGAIALVIGLPMIFLLYRERGSTSSASSGEAVFGTPAAEARRSPLLWMLIAITALTVTVWLGVQSHLFNYLGDHGIDRTVAANVVSAAALAGLCLQLFTGWVLDRFDTPKVVLPYIGVSLLGLLLLAFVPGPVPMTGGAVLLIAGAGAELTMMPYLITRFFGLRAFNELYGTYYLIGSLGMAAAPVFMGAVFDRTGGYALGFGVFAAFLVVALLLILIMPPYRFAPQAR